MHFIQFLFCLFPVGPLCIASQQKTTASAVAFTVISEAFQDFSNKQLNDSLEDILRVKCKECGKTHAVLLSLIVPYQSVELEIQIQILKDEDVEKIMVNNEAIDEQEVYRIRKRFKTKYKKWMSLNKLSFLDDLVKLAFRDFKSNFMQIRKGCYNLI